jgi:hypothetical protein
MTRSTNKTRVFPIVLKAIIRNAIDEKTISDADEKRIRMKLRVNERALTITKHVKNSTWQAFNQAQYDAIRCAFDDDYATMIANTRNAKRKVKGEETTNEDA